MRFLFARFRNIGPFLKRRFDFSGNLIGVVGPNGSGKSTLIEMLYSVLTGDFRKHSNLAEFVSDLPGGSKAQSGTVEVGFEHGGQEYTIRRVITVTKKDGVYRGTQKAIFKHGDVEINGARAVDKALQELLGEDLTLLGQYAFIEQNALTAIIDCDDSSRTRGLHKLFGLDRFEKLWGVLGEEVRGVPELRNAEDPAQLRIEHVQLEEQLASEKRRKISVAKELSDLDPAQAELDIRSWEGLNEVREKLTRAEEQHSAATNTLATAQGNQTSLVQQVRMAEEDSNRLSAKAVQAANFIKDAQTAAMAVQRKEELRLDVERVTGDCAALKVPALPVTGWTDEDQSALKLLESELDTSLRFLAGYTGVIPSADPVCPTCKQPIEDLQHQLQLHRETVNRLQPQATGLQQQKMLFDNEHLAHTKAQATYTARYNQLMADGQRLIAAYQAAEGACPADPTKYSDAECAQRRAAISDFDSANGVHKTLERSLSTVSDVVAAAESTCQAAQTLLDGVKAEQRTLGERVAKLDGEHIKRCRARITLASDKRLDLARLGERCDQLVIQRDQRLVSLERAELMAVAIEKANYVRQTLSDARDVFHRDGLPRVLAERYLSAIDAHLQQFLSLMQSDFTASMECDDGGYRFRCVFSDAAEREASALSGGEKTRFAVSFLLAVNEVMASRLGVLALDEPTAQLDDSNVQHFSDVLGHVQQYAASAGVQVFLVTHAHELRGSFDQCIELSKY